MAHSRTQNSIPLKVMIDKKNQRVAFAEAGATFTDTLVSFLTIPLGTVIKLLISRPELPSLGSTKNLYQSLSDLHQDMFCTSVCKTMLLHPKNAAADAYRGLKFKVDCSDWEAETNYFCPSICSFSLYEGMKCHCGQEMTMKRVSAFQAQMSAFVNPRLTLLIGDDMRLTPLSTMSIATLLQDKGLTDQCNVLERKDVHVEVLELLVNVLFSGTPLTDLVFPKKPSPIYAPTNDATFLKIPKDEVGGTAEDKARKIQVKLIVRKSDKKLLYAEAGSDFMDLIFSFLTIPTGAIVKLLGGNSPMKSLNSLCSSIKDSTFGNLLKVSKELLVNPKQKVSKELLVNPKLAPTFKCDNQLLDLIQEERNGIINPKIPIRGNSDGGNFMKAAELFMVTDDLLVRPLASTDIVSVLDGFKVPICNVEEILATVGKCEALNLLKASLGSNTVLTDVFRTFLGASNSLNGQSFSKGGQPFC